jgi:hypothetical protein
MPSQDEDDYQYPGQALLAIYPTGIYEIMVRTTSSPVHYIEQCQATVVFFGMSWCQCFGGYT